MKPFDKIEQNRASTNYSNTQVKGTIQVNTEMTSYSELYVL